jgi:hypothetical protein
MLSSPTRYRTYVFLGFAALAGLSAVDCRRQGLPGLPGGAPGCPSDLSSVQAVMAANYGFEPQVEAKVKATLAAGVNLQALAMEVETEVATACGNLAKDLGVADVEPTEQGPGKRAEAACNAAVKALGEVKAKAGGKLVLDVTPPKCMASMNAMVDCAARCDANIQPGSVKATCEGGELSGECSGKCSGSCEVQAGAQCEGTCGGSCSGTCEGQISGKCEGTCKGKCDGKDTKGKGAKCAGVCDGTCSGGKVEAECEGSCKGTCSATCTMKAEAACSGTCSGSCDVEFKEPKCSGQVKPPEMSAECQANCDAELSGKVECVPARVVVKIEGGADAEAGAKLVKAIEANLPALLKVTQGMRGRLEGAVGSVRASVEGMNAAVTQAGVGALHVAGCFAYSMQAQAQASMSINVSVQASASASAEAGASSG